MDGWIDFLLVATMDDRFGGNTSFAFCCCCHFVSFSFSICIFVVVAAAAAAAVVCSVVFPSFADCCSALLTFILVFWFILAPHSFPSLSQSFWHSRLSRLTGCFIYFTITSNRRRSTSAAAAAAASVLMAAPSQKNDVFPISSEV